MDADINKMEASSKSIQIFKRIFCEINNNNQKEIGFFCKIFSSNTNELIPALITNATILPFSEIIPGKKIEFIFNNNSYVLTIDDTRKIYRNKDDYNITIIEIKKEDNLDINLFVDIELNDGLNLDDFKKKSIFLLIKENDTIKFKECKIIGLGQKDFEIEYSCDLDKEVYGCPIVDIINNKIIGIHKNYDMEEKISKGILLNTPIKKFLIHKNIFSEEINIKKPISKLNIEIILTYSIPHKEKAIKLFGAEFVKNNKDKCYLRLNDSDNNIMHNCDLCEYINIDKIPDIGKQIKSFNVILVQTDYFIDMSYMFFECFDLMAANEISLLKTEKVKNMSSMFLACKKLNELKDIGNLNTSQVTDMTLMFGWCVSLKELPSLSKWDTNKVQNLSSMFEGCGNLETISGIENWDTCNVTNVHNLFNKCKNLKQIPDISKWNTINIVEMSFMFNHCDKITNLPDISKWNLKNVKKLQGLFSGLNLEVLPDISNWDVSNAINLQGVFYELKVKFLPDISKWNVSKAEDLSNLFAYSHELISIPDISKWNIGNAKDISQIFVECFSITSVPDIKNWDTKNVEKMNGLFQRCKLLKTLPDISNWNISKTTQISRLFCECISLETIPDISKWDTKNIN